MPPDRRDKHVSRPSRSTINVLAVDGTDCEDSLAFVDLLRTAGRKLGVSVRNLLSYLPAVGKGGNQRRDSLVPVDAPVDMPGFPFSGSQIPMKLARRGRWSALVMLPQGEVFGKTNVYNDALLTTDQSQRSQKATENSKFTEVFVLAPSVADPDTEAASLCLAKNDSSTYANTAIVYLSGHGSMSGQVVGEDPNYLPFFRMLNLAAPNFQKLAATDGPRAPLWMVIASCFSLRKSTCELWERYLRKQAIPIRGILGYQATAPLSNESISFNQRFAKCLSEGKSIIDSWRLAHRHSSRYRVRWTAMVYKPAAADTMETLLAPPPVSPSSELIFCSEEGGQEPVRIRPPQALLEMRFWNGLGWPKFLITNIDFDQASLAAYVAQNPADRIADNQAWQYVKGKTKYIDLEDDYISYISFFRDRYYLIGVFPPFATEFKQGWSNGDDIDFTVVHVREDYKKKAVFKDLFEVVGVNGVKCPPATYQITQPVKSTTLDTVTISAPTGFEPAQLALKFISKAPKGAYLWFWFRVRVRRNGTQIFEGKFDAFTVFFETDQHYIHDELTAGTRLPDFLAPQ